MAIVAKARPFVALTLVAACSSADTPSPSTSPTDVVRGGTRLAAVFLQIPSEVDVFQHFRDRELDTPCTFASTGTSEVACLPSGPEAVYIGDTAFADAACATPVVVVPEGTPCSPPRFAVEKTTCEGPPRVLRLRERHAGPYFRPGPQGCQRLEGGFASGKAFLFDEIDTRTLVRGRLVVGAPVDGVAAVQVEGEDGSRALFGLRDAAGGWSCALERRDGEVRCRPDIDHTVDSLFADSGCELPAARKLVTCPDPNQPMSVALEIGSGRYRFRRVGDRLAQTYQRSADGCHPSTQADAASSLGDELPWASFERGSVHERQGRSGLLITTVEAGGVQSPSPRLGTSADVSDLCYFAAAADGRLRCLPTPIRFFPHYFADPTCTTRAAYVDGNRPLAVTDEAMCPPRVRVFGRGQRHQTAVYRLDGGRCEPVGGSPPDSARTPYFTFPTELPATDFVPLERVER